MSEKNQNPELSVVSSDDIIFAVKKDGGIMFNLSDEKGVCAEYCLKLFEGLALLASQANKQEIAGIALTKLILEKEFDKAIIAKMEQHTDKKE